jgi:hypothetical protein
VSHILKSAAAFLLLCGAASAENAVDRPLEESIVISPVIVTARIVKADGELTEAGATHKRFRAEVTAVIRTPGHPEKGGAVTVHAVNGLTPGDELILFLGTPAGNSRRVHRTAPVKDLALVKKLLALETRADKELGGKDKLRAAFFHAHRLRPVLRAAAEKKALKPAGAVPPKEQDALLAILASALAEASKPKPAAETKALAELLRKVLSGPGGLPQYRMRGTRVAQFWNRQLNDAAQRKKYRLMKLALVDPAGGDADKAAATAKAAPKAERTAVMEVWIDGKKVLPRPGAPAVLPVEKLKPKPAPPKRKAAPAPKPVNGLALECAAGRASYDLVDKPEATVDLTATFRNTGRSAIRFNSYVLFPVLARVLITDPAGKNTVYAAKDRLTKAEIPAMGVWSFKELKPDGTLSFTEKLPASVFSKNGDYVLRIVYKNAYGKRFGISAWTGEVVSHSITVNVLKQRPPKPKAKPAPPT